MFKKVVAGLLVLVLAWLLVGCGRTEAPPEETVSATTEFDGTSAETEPTEEIASYSVWQPGETVLWTPEMEIRQERASFAAGPWQDAYAAFLRAPEKYDAEKEDHHAGCFVLADLSNDGIPELIIKFYNGIEGGSIFANIYLYDGNIRIIGQQVDMYYKGLYCSTDPSFPGVFIYGGRVSNFNCNYWTMKNNKFVDVPLWTDIADEESHDMVYKELTSDKQLIAEAKKVMSLYPYGIESSGIDEDNIQKTIYT